MLTITLELSKDKVLEYTKKSKQIYDAGHYLYLAKDNGEVLAAGLFKIEGDMSYIAYYETTEEKDYHLFDGILRAGFNYAGDQGISTGMIPESFREQYTGFFERLNYPNQPMFEISNFFSKYKNCGG